MGGVWCRADKGRSYSSPKLPLTSTITKWTDNMRQAYKKPKKYPHRPPRPPQKPLRVNNRLTISHPQLVAEASSDGWRTMTLMVPPLDSAPVPPPRKKRKRHQELTRAAYSMDELNLRDQVDTPMSKCRSETSLPESRSTILVTPVLESRVEEVEEDEEKENVVGIKVEDEEEFPQEIPEEIIPIEKETLFSSRTLLHSNLGFVDKLSAISEVSTVSTESGFDDRVDIYKSGSVSSSDRDSGLNILAHIQDINTVSQLNETNKDIREKTAISKKEWLQNILRDDSDISEQIRGENQTVSRQLSERLHLMNPQGETSVSDNGGKTPPPTPETLDSNPANHSVLLELLQKTRDERPVTNPFLQGESIFLTDTKTNIVYKSLSSDNLTEVYDYNENDGNEITNKTKDCPNTPYIFDITFQVPTVDCNHVNSVTEEKKTFSQSICDSKDISKDTTTSTSKNEVKDNVEITINGNASSSTSTPSLHFKLGSNDKLDASKLTVEETSNQKDSLTSSRKSSITDSLHEFEMSIYDMLNESKKNRDSSDEEESLKVTKEELLAASNGDSIQIRKDDLSKI